MDALSSACRTERAFHLARYRHDPTSSKEVLDAADRKLCPQVLTLRAEAAIYLESQQYERTIATIDQALQALDAMHVPQSLDDEREWLQQMRTEAIAAVAEHIVLN